jgi:hypothetical protein
MEFKSALAHVQGIRQVVCPNFGFREQLRTFQKRLQDESFNSLLKAESAATDEAIESAAGVGEHMGDEPARSELGLAVVVQAAASEGACDEGSEGNACDVVPAVDAESVRTVVEQIVDGNDSVEFSAVESSQDIVAEAVKVAALAEEITHHDSLLHEIAEVVAVGKVSEAEAAVMPSVMSPTMEISADSHLFDSQPAPFSESIPCNVSPARPSSRSPLNDLDVKPLTPLVPAGPILDPDIISLQSSTLEVKSEA